MERRVRFPWGLMAIGEMVIWILFGLLLISVPGLKTAEMLLFGIAVLFGLMGLLVLKGQRLNP